MTARTDDEVARIMSFGPPADVMDAVSALMLDVSLCDYSEEVWVLGRSYLLSDHDPGQRARFAADVRSRLWMSYRRGFEPIAYTSLQADSGWGCMLRCGQMMLAQAFVQQQLGDDWETSPRGNSVKRGILRWFGDAPSCPFSIHRIAERGAIIGKRVGEWFGPNAMAQVMKSLVADNASPCNLSVYIAMDGQLAKEAAEAAATKGGTVPWSPLLLLIPLRLGLDSLQPQYIPELRRMFKMPYSLGAMGGRPNSAFYFVGVRGHDLIHLDPHTTQGVVDMKGDFPLDTYHCKPRHLRLSQADPSMCLGFLCQEREEYEDLLTRLANTGGHPPLFSICEKDVLASFDGEDFAMTESEGESDGFEVVSMP